MPNPRIKIGRFIDLPLHFVLILIATFFLIIFGAFFCAVPFVQLGYGPVEPYSLEMSHLYRINVNIADIQQLCAVPGIGEKKAKLIIEYRENYGAFHSLEDLTNVKGISNKSIENWREYLYVA